MGNIDHIAVNGSHALLGAEITGGFLGGAEMQFAPGLNCIIGGRGTGKTTILEFIRYGLGMMPDQKRGSRSRAHSVVKNNLSNGHIRLHLHTLHGMRYTADRPLNDECQVLDENGDATAISLNRDRIFKADIYSQNQIEQIATDTGFQLKLIDQFEEENIQNINTEISRLLRDIEHSAGSLRQFDRQIGDLTETASEAPAIEEKLKGFQQQTEGPNADAINTAHGNKAVRDREQHAMGYLQSEISSFSHRYQKAIHDLMYNLQGQMHAPLLSGPNQDLFSSANALIGEMTDELHKSIPWVAQHCSTIMANLNTMTNDLNLRHAQQEQSYRQLIEQSQAERGRAVERTQLQKRYLEVTEAKRQLDELVSQRRQSHYQHQQMAARLSTLRDERFKLRKKVADYLTSTLNPTIRVTMTQAGNIDKYAALLTDGLKGSGLRYASIVDKVASNLAPAELSSLIQSRNADQLAEMAGLDPTRSTRVIELLANDHFLIRLESVDLEDLPCIELLDGRDYKDASALSTGQRCTTILPILLMESERPLLIDQPEDNLDNAFIFETIVRSVKEAKASRQLIFITHNPNIPVLAEADRVFVLSSDGRQGAITHSGSVDEVKEQIETLLEGGREAFLRRKERYGH
ncbi:MAG: AAA family ATPase [Magnetococcales bacterium]|nr:AAA family ATPase [Magnetococcales bacterium]